MQELVDDLYMFISAGNFNDDNLKQHLIMICSNYDIDKKCTDLSVYSCEDFNMELLQKFLISKTVAGLTQRTLRHYRTSILFFLDRVTKRIDDITPDDIKLYIARRQLQDHVTSVTAINEWRILSSFFGWLHKEEILLRNPMFKVEKPKVRKQKKKAFTSMECERIRNACKTKRDKAIVEVLLSTWCRVSEVEQMNIDDICDDEITVLGKGQKERTVYLNSKAQLAIHEYLQSRTDNNPCLFCAYNEPHDRLRISSFEIMFREMGKELGIDNCHPHRFRRTGATMALRGGMPIEKVSYLLGHESIETTQIYLDMSEDDAKQAHKKYVV